MKNTVYEFGLFLIGGMVLVLVFCIFMFDEKEQFSISDRVDAVRKTCLMRDNKDHCESVVGIYRSRCLQNRNKETCEQLIELIENCGEHIDIDLCIPNIGN